MVPAAPHASAQTTAQITAHAGAPATLQVRFPLVGWLLNREAPNRLTLHTRWGRAAGLPVGPAHTVPEFRGYFAKVRPLTLRVPLPLNVRPGLYAARLSGPLFVCGVKAKVCLRRDVHLAVEVRVLPAGHAFSSTPLTLTDAMFQLVR